MRRTFHLGETNRSRRIEDKLIYMEGTAEQLLEENHRLKTELFVNGRAHEDLLQDFINNVRTAQLCELAHQPGDTTAQEFKKAAKQVILTYAQTKLTIENLEQNLLVTNRSLTQAKEDIVRSQSLIHTKENQLQQVLQESENAYVTRLNNLRAENHRQQLQLSQLRSELEGITEKSSSESRQLNFKIDSLKMELSSSQREHNNQMRESMDGHHRQIKRLKQEFQDKKAYLIDSYCKVIEVKKEENAALMKALNKEQPSEPNIYTDSFRMIELRDLLNREVEEVRKIASDRSQEIDRLLEDLEHSERQLSQSKAANEDKKQQIKELKQLASSIEKAAAEKQLQLDRAQLTLEKEHKEKEQQDKSMSRKWEQEVERLLMSQQLSIRQQTAAVRAQCEKRFSTQIIGLNCEILAQKDKQEQLHTKISRLVFEINQLGEQKEKCQVTIKKQEEDYIQLKQDLQNVITDKEIQLELAKKDILQRDNAIELLREELSKREGQIANLVFRHQQQRIQFENQIEDLQEKHIIELHNQKVNAEIALDEALRTLKDQLIDDYETAIDRLKQDYEQQLQNLRLSRDLIVNNLKEQLQESNERHGQELERIRQEERQMKWNMDSKLREERMRHKEDIDKSAAEILAIKIDFGRATKINEEHVAKIAALQATIVDNHRIREGLLAEIRSLKQTIEGLTSEIKNLQGMVEQRQIAISKLEGEVKAQQARYNNVKEEIQQTRFDLRHEINNLQLKHDRMELFYKSQSRKMENYIVSRPSEQCYLKEIEELRRERTSLDSNLIKCEAELIKIREVSKYKDGQLENLKEKFKHIQVESIKGTSRARLQTQPSGFNTHHEEMTSGSQQYLLKKTAYQKFSTSRKSRRNYKVVEASAFKGGLVNYSLVNTIKQRFRLHSPPHQGRPQIQSKP